MTPFQHQCGLQRLLRAFNHSIQPFFIVLIEKGFAREAAYDLVQPKAMQAWEERQSFRGLLEADETVAKYLNAADLDDCFDHTYHLKSVDGIFERLGL